MEEKLEQMKDCRLVRGRPRERGTGDKPWC